ncbi:MAG: hypothetical protein HRT86_17175, partial [Ilumatobacteraceae bacterium]|nr:hypothetical protein [Ilumatobacteraceae bacterium]
ASEGDVDVDNDLGNQLWKTKDEWDGTTQENLVQVLQTQYPGYKFKEKSGKRETIEGTNIDGREIIVTAPNGETTSIYGGIQGRTTFTDKSNVNNEVRNQKINLTNFINKNGIDLKQVAGKFAGTTQQYYQLINTPYNSENVNLGGIGLDKRQQNTLNSIGLVQYVADKDGKISEEFTYNPELFKGTYEKWIEQEKAFLEAEPGRYSEFYMTQQGSLVVKGLLTKEDLDNWDTKEVRDKVSQLLTDQYPRYEQYQDFDRDEKGNITSATKKTKTRKLVRNDLIRLQGSVMGREQVGTTGGDGEFIAVGENSELYKRTKQALENTYSKYNIPVTEDMVKQAVAQKAYSDYKNGAIDANLNEYLWKADNANKTQALAAYGSIVTKDSKLQTAMGLQSVNEAEIREYNKLTPDLATVEFFEQTYNDPDALFETEGVPPEELFRLRNGKMVSQKLFNDYVAAKDRRDLQWKALAKRRDKIWKIQDDVGDIDANIKLLEKDYNTWTSSWTTLGLTFADIGVGIGYLGMKASKYIPIGNPASVMMYAGEGLQMFTGEENEFTKFWDEWDEAFASEYDDYSYWKEGVKAQYGREVQFHADGFGRGGAFQPGNFGRFVAQEVAKQIPIITTLALTGGTAG